MTLTVRGLSYTAFADAAAKNTCFPNLVEFNGAAADDARAYESAKVQDHNRKYRQTSPRRAEGLAPGSRDARRAADAVGDLVAPRCGPKLRADDKPKPPRKFPRLRTCGVNGLNFNRIHYLRAATGAPSAARQDTYVEYQIAPPALRQERRRRPR